MEEVRNSFFSCIVENQPQPPPAPQEDQLPAALEGNSSETNSWNFSISFLILHLPLFFQLPRWQFRKNSCRKSLKVRIWGYTPFFLCALHWNAFLLYSWIVPEQATIYRIKLHLTDPLLKYLHLYCSPKPPAKILKDVRLTHCLSQGTILYMGL